MTAKADNAAKSNGTTVVRPWHATIDIEHILEKRTCDARKAWERHPNGVVRHVMQTGDWPLGTFLLFGCTCVFPILLGIALLTSGFAPIVWGTVMLMGTIVIAKPAWFILKATPSVISRFLKITSSERKELVRDVLAFNAWVVNLHEAGCRPAETLKETLAERYDALNARVTDYSMRFDRVIALQLNAYRLRELEGGIYAALPGIGYEQTTSLDPEMALVEMHGRLQEEAESLGLVPHEHIPSLLSE